MTKKILMFGWEFPPEFNGGLGVACYGLTKAMSQCEDIDVTLVLPKKMEIDKTVESYIFADEINNSKGIITITSINSILTSYSTYDVYSSTRINANFGKNSEIYGSTIFEEVMRYAEKVKNLTTVEYDIIHAHDWLTIPASIEVKNKTNKPLILHIHATEIDRTGGMVDQRIYDIERYGMENADYIIAVSEHTKNIIIEHYGIDGSKIEVIHNGIDAEGFRYAPICNRTIERLQVYKDQGYSIVLFVGRLTIQKGIQYLLEAAKQVIENRPKTLFVIAGSGELQESLIRLSAKLKISKNILFTGWIGGGQRTSLYSVADLFVMPSISEPFGLVSLEAATHNTPIILSKTSGAKEILKNAIAVDYWDTDLTAEMIFSVLEYAPLKNLLSELAFLESQSATWELATKKITKLYNYF